MVLREWAAAWNIPLAAIVDLEQRCGLLGTPGVVDDGKSEAHAQSVERLAASRAGVILFRNNVGVLPDENGRPVRYGLANESKEQNKVLKSSDLIGIKPNGQLVAREMKPAGWRYTGTEREVAQLAFITLINAKGGDAAFSTGASAW
jgi:hypothetical protein